MATKYSKAEIVAHRPAISIWKTITIGNISREKFIPALKECGTKAGDWAISMMKQVGFTVVDQEEQIDLVLRSARELGFNKEARYDAICRQAKKQRFELCPPEVGPQVRLQYLNQPLGENLVIAMEAIRGSGLVLIFGVGCDSSGLWLICEYGKPNICWPLDYRFVFRAPAVADKALTGRRKKSSDA